MKTGMIATGVILHDRETGKDYGLHSACLEKLSNASPAAFHPFTGRYSIIGPLFASPDEWECADTTCDMEADK